MGPAGPGISRSSTLATGIVLPRKARASARRLARTLFDRLRLEATGEPLEAQRELHVNVELLALDPDRSPRREPCQAGRQRRNRPRRAGLDGFGDRAHPEQAIAS